MNVRVVKAESWSLILLMQKSFAELCMIYPEIAYQYTFVYIRQTAIHLRNAMIAKRKVTYFVFRLNLNYFNNKFRYNDDTQIILLYKAKFEINLKVELKLKRPKIIFEMNRVKKLNLTECTKSILFGFLRFSVQFSQ